VNEPSDFAALVVAYLDGGADAVAVRRLEAQLRAEPARRAEFVALATMQGLLEELSLASPASVPTRLDPRVRAWRGRMHWALTAGLAALVVLGLTLWSLHVDAARSVAAVDGLQGVVILQRAGTSAPLVLGERLRAGDAVRTPAQGSCAWRFGDGSHVVLAADASVVLPDAPNQATIELTQGQLTAEVTPQAAGRHFQVRTPRGLVTVVGTAFSVAVDAQGTRVAVLHGTVSLQASQGDAVAVHAGEEAQIDAGHGWVARLVLPEATAPQVPPPAPLAVASALHPFASSSWWNRPCPPGSVLRELQGAQAVPWDALAIGTVQVRQVVAGSSAWPLRAVVRRGGTASLGTVHAPADLRLERGVSQGGFLILIDADARTIWEGTRPEIKRDGTIAVTAVSELMLDGDGMPVERDGGNAPGALEGGLPSGLPACAGLVRLGELEQGITHVLAMTMPPRCINADVSADAHWVAPASGPRVPPPTCAHAGTLHVGSRLVLPSGIAAGLPAGPLRVLALALERYGACVVGFSDRPQLCAEATAGAQAAPMAAAVGALCARLRVADPR
jgi:ferric-dicitrate binding protein FerR (iron transport regulator)